MKIKKFISIILVMLICMALIPMSVSADSVIFTVLEGTAGDNGESYDKLIDGKKSDGDFSKWGVKNFTSAYVVIQASEPIVVTGYALTTGNDNDSNKGRNPKDWKLYGSNSYNNSDADGGSWSVIDTVTNDTTMQDRNYASYFFDVNNSTSYKYYKFEITANRGADFMQLAELELEYKEDASNYTLTALDGTTTASSESYHKLVDGKKTNLNFSKWCVGNFTNAYIIIESSKNIRVTGYTFTTGNDNAENPGRNPKDWKLYASNDYNKSDKTASWTLIDTVTNDTTMQDRNYTPYSFAVLNNNAYRYYKLEISQTRNSNVMQLAEMEFITAHDVMFDTNGGSQINPNIIKSGGGLPQTNPTKAGYEFVGWYTKNGTDNGNWGEKFTEKTVVLSDMTVYARWKKIISFTAVDGTVNSKEKENYDKLIDGKKNANNGTKWCMGGFPLYIVIKASEKIIVNGYKLTTANDTASYSGRNPKSWKLYGCNDYDETNKSGGSWAVIDEITDDTKLGAKNYTSYLFGAGNNDAYKYYKFEITKNGGANLTQLAELEFEYDRVYNVTFDKNGGDTEAVPKVIENGKGLPHTNPTRAGYEFVGWYTQNGADGNWGEEFTDISSASDNLTVFARWSSFNTEKDVYFEVLSGSPHNSYIDPSSAGYIGLMDGKKTEDNFSKWVIDRSYNAHIVFQASEPVIPRGYIYTTGNTVSENVERNPSLWELRASIDNNSWDIITHVENDTTMKASNYTSYTYSIDNSANKKYKYYTLYIMWDGKGDYKELAEFELIYERVNKEFNLGTAQITGNAQSNVYFGKYPQKNLGASEPTSGVKGTDWIKSQTAIRHDMGPYYSIDPIKWRVFNNSDGKMLMISDKSIDGVRYNETATKIGWGNSTIRSWLNGYGAAQNKNAKDYTNDNFIKTAFSNYEISGMASDENSDKVSLARFSDMSKYGWKTREKRISYNTDYVYGGGKNGGNGSRSKDGGEYWWIYNSGTESENVDQINSLGTMQKGKPNTLQQTVRPVITIDSSSVLFSTAATGGKIIKCGKWQENKEERNFEKIGYKLTVKDNNRNFKIDKTMMRISSVGKKEVYFNYTGAETGANEYVSAVIVNDESKILYYAQLKQVTEPNGTISFVLPQTFDNGTYILKIFNEKINGDYKTDISSTFSDVVLRVSIPEITFDKNGGDAGIKQPVYKQGNGFPEDKPSRKNYEFVGWYTKNGKNGDWGEEFTSQSEALRDITVYARWRRIQITFDKNYEGCGESEVIALGDGLPQTNPTRAGYNFAGWFIKNENGDWGAAFSRNTEMFEDTTVYAKWNRNIGNIKLGLNGVADRQESNVYYGKYPNVNIGGEQPADGIENIDWMQSKTAIYNNLGPYYSIDPIKWRVLDNSNGKLLLFTDRVVDTLLYCTEHHSIWNESMIRKWLNGYNDFSASPVKYYPDFSFSEYAFADKERAAISTGTSDVTDKIFLLSTQEMSDINYGFYENASRVTTDTNYVSGGGSSGDELRYYYGSVSGYCWARKGEQENTAGYYIGGDGRIGGPGFQTNQIGGIRPAMNLDAESIIFTSDAVGSKTAEGGLSPVPISDKIDYKLTLKDKARMYFGISDVSKKGNEVTFNYQTATFGENNYISAIVKNVKTIKYYGKLKKVESALDSNGTLTVTLPDDFDAENLDELYIINEQCNGDYNTDYSSELKKAVSSVSTITFDSNGGDMGTSENTISVGYEFPQTNPKREGYIFDGWYTKNGENDDWGEQLTFESSLTVKTNITVYAKWRQIKITFDSNGGTAISPNTIMFGDAMPTVLPKKSGYAMIGWYTKNGENNDWGEKVLSSSMVDSDTTLYARWEKLNYGNAAGTNFEAVSGTTGNSNENYNNLTNTNLSKKWCVSNFNGANVIFRASNYVVVEGYSFTTGNDNASNKGRNPKTWKIYGSNDYDESSKLGTWTEIQSVTNDTTMQDKNYETYSFNVENDEGYKYYKLDISAIQNGTVLQLSRVVFECATCNHNWKTSASSDANCAESGYVSNKCETCGKIRKKITAEPLGHNCNETGYCSRCKKTLPVQIGTEFYDDLYKAVNAADSSDTVKMNADVEISETIKVTGNLTLDLNGKTITKTGDGSAVRIEKNATFTLKDESKTKTGKISGGKRTAGNVINEWRGGVVYSEGTFNMKGGTLTNGVAQQSGGGVHIENGTFVMDGGIIENCLGDYEGGGVSVENSTFTMNGGEIRNNKTNRQGGGVYLRYYGKMILNGGSISNNVSVRYGGGIYVDTSANFEMNGGKISGNYTDISDNKEEMGGGIYATAGANSIKLKAGKIENNSSEYGGGIAITQGATATVSADTVISGNRATIYGGGIYNEGSTLNISGTPVVNCTAGKDGNDILKAYRITFNRSQDYYYASQIVKEGSNAVGTEPEYPSSSSVFGGWFENGKGYDFTKVLTRDVRVIAKWLNSGRNGISITPHKVYVASDGTAAKLYVGAYKNNKLVGSYVTTVNANKEVAIADTGLNTIGADILKAFLWNENMKPLCGSSETAID